MNWLRVVSAIGGQRVGRLFIPEIFTTLLKENAETHRKLGEIPLLKNLENRNVTREQYTAALKKFYGLYASLEPTLERAINWGQLGINFNERRRLPLLIRDLEKFGVRGDMVSSIPVCTEVPEFKTLSEVLGCMAVVEGSTAGAAATAKKLVDSNLHLGPDNGAAFFNNYGDKRLEMRVSFANVVTALNVNKDEFLCGGRKAFDIFYNWLSS